jgi:histidine ammonia-lyase
MSDPVVLRSIEDMTLANAARVAFDRARISIADEAAARIAGGRERFQDFMRTKGGYVYGSTTAPGSRAKVILGAEEALRQGQTLAGFVPLQPGVGGEMLAERCVRLAIYARLSNAMTGSGKLYPDTVQAVADLLDAVPPVPLQGVSCSGEVMPLAWLMAPLGKRSLAQGEAMALINGSPFATAMGCDVALTASRRLRLIERVFALSIAAAQCPMTHFNLRLASGWKDPYYRQGLANLQELLQGTVTNELQHQAPTSWRVLPNVLACALRAIAEVSHYAEIALQSLKDNPTFLQDPASSDGDVVVSSGGYHDHQAAKAIDAVNSVLADLCVLASRQVTHLLDGGGLGLPPLLACAGDGVGAEYLAWGMTEPLVAARRCAEGTTLDIGLQDPVGNQSDIASLAFTAYGKHLQVSRAADACFAALAVTAIRALRFRGNAQTVTKCSLNRSIEKIVSSGSRATDAAGGPLREVKRLLRAAADELTTVQFAQQCLAG